MVGLDNSIMFTLAIVAGFAGFAGVAFYDPGLLYIYVAFVLIFVLFFNNFNLRRTISEMGPSPDIVYENAFAAYCLVDAQSNHVEISSNLNSLLGYPSSIARVDHLVNAFASESRQRFERAVEEIRQGKIQSPLVLAIEGKDCYCECHMTSRSDDTGKIRLLILWFVDVTNYYKNQLRLVQENENHKADLKQYSTILNMAPYPIWQRSVNLDIQFYNLAYGEVVEDDTERSEGSQVPELDKRMQAQAKQALESGKPVSDRRHIVVAGERRLLQITEFPMTKEQMTVGFAIDISEVELLGEDLDRHISAQADLLESSASAMAIYGADMRLKSCNFAFVSLWKFDEAWLDTQPTYSEILEALREKRKLPEQANFQLFKQQQLKMFTDLIEPQEEFFYLPDGKTLRVIAIPHALGGILFAYEDVTDRLALERSYNTLIAVQRETLDNLHEGVAVFGEHGRLSLNNPVYLKLWNVDKTLASQEPHINDLLEYCKPLYQYDDWGTYKKHLLLQSQNRTHGNYRMERSDGKVLDWSVVPLPDGATLVTYLDVTDSTLVERSLLERNNALQEADKLKTEFLANVSYELRSPLTSISGFSDMLRQEYFGTLSEKQREYVEGIHLSSLHLMQLINDILDLASVEAGYMRLEVSKFDIYAAMKSVLSLIQERAKELGLKLKFECASRLGKMTGDETRIKQIMFNLLSNAIKYSEAGNTVSFGARELDEDHICLWVEDEGQGIPIEEHEIVFSKFYKGRNQEGAKGKSGQRSGTGLGLSIVKSFVELHGGQIELRSEPGKGTRFECILERHRPELQSFIKMRKSA